MTIIDKVCPVNIFEKVLDAFFDGRRDSRTLEMI